MNPANQTAVATIVAEHGITQAGIEAAYEEGILVGAMRAAQAIASGSVASAPTGDTAAMLSATASAALRKLGIDPAKKWTQRSSTFTVVDYQPSRWKFPVTCATQNGTRYKFTVAQVLAHQR